MNLTKDEINIIDTALKNLIEELQEWCEDQQNNTEEISPIISQKIQDVEDLKVKLEKILTSDPQSVEARNQLQKSGKVHPYTCGNDECRKKTNQAPLRAIEGGWICDYCGYTQAL